MINKITLWIMLITFTTVLWGCQNNPTKPIPEPTPLEDSPEPSLDTRMASVYEDERIIIDNTNQELMFKQASTYKYNAGSTAIGANFISSEKGTAFEATFTPNIETAGYYKIYINFPEFEQAYDQVPLVVTYEGGANVDDTKAVNQTINAGYWVMVGTYYLTTGKNNKVQILPVENQYVLVDAMMFELSSENDVLQTETKPVLIEPYEPSSVTNILKTHDQKLRLSVNGEEFFVKGVNGIDELELIAEAGGNSVRTYSTDALQDGALLDRAHELGIKVVIGLWMNHESGSFTYANNPDKVEQQYQKLILEVEKYKKHPAVLGWAVGNEVDISTSLNMRAIYDAMNQIAKYIHESDPYHPTMAVLAGSSPLKIGSIRRFAPHIDMIGINTYSAIGNVANNILGWKGPYLITEYALNQPMETKLKTSWGAIIEPKSIDKADLYYERYQQYIYGKRDEGVVGSYVFKDTGSFRVTHTWYGIILNGKRTAAFEGVKAGFFETERIPTLQIDEVKINNQTSLQNVILESGTANIQVTTLNESGNIKYTYEVRKDVGLSVNTDPSPQPSFTFVEDNAKNNVTMTIPEFPGNYRLFVYVENDTHISSYSFPFQVSGDPFILEEQPGVQIVSIKSEIGYVETGTFSSSTNRFYDGFLTRFTRVLGNYATFTPDLEPGKYEVFYYNLSEGLGQTDDNQIEINIYYANGAKETIILGVTTTSEGWVSLGEYSFNADGLEYVTVVKMIDGTKVVRTTAIAFLPKN
ncbi:hypothetical protein N7548_01595 [Acholeplasma manati]|uniref:Golvesin/Xly CBD-like domain-containing protein n=1 Tax=Paracholeplasma manati TaxID=591373 RepID=A0ABT2Y462_9MOLU|nr:hypothetical protein [Paracholeplasma manati]MCV2231522.1 hypothetical protein [Paracholeplasma manati]